MKPELLTDEVIINTWTIMYLPPTGGQYNGKLTVTNQRLIYDAQFDISAQGIVNELFYVRQGEKVWLSIPKVKITRTELIKSFFAKKVLVTTDNGETHVFNYGMLNVTLVYDAILKK